MGKLYLLCKTITYFTSIIGIYEVIRLLWEKAEIAEFGKATVSKADTGVATLLTVIAITILIAVELKGLDELIWWKDGDE